MTHAVHKLHSFGFNQDTITKEAALLFLKPPEDKVILVQSINQTGKGIEKLNLEKERALKADLNFLGGYAKPVAEIAALCTTQQYGEAWGLFHETFLKDPAATEKYMNMVSKEYNLLYYLQKVPVAGLSFKIPYALMRGAVGVTNWGLGIFKKNFGNAADKTKSAFAIFKNASTTWEGLTKEQQVEFIKFAETMAKNLPVDTILQATHQQYAKTLGKAVVGESQSAEGVNDNVETAFHDITKQAA